MTFDDVLDAVSRIDPARNDQYLMNDDISAGNLFARIIRKETRFNTTANEWFYYDGKVWKKDEGGVNIEALAKKTTRALYTYAIDQSKDFQKYVLKLQSRYSRNKMIKDAIDLYPVSSESFDKNLNLFNVQNGVLNLETGELMEHDPDLLLTKIANVRYDPEASSDEFIKFLREVLPDDEGKIRYLQKLSGYALTGDNCQEEAYMIYGPLTRNGKSTFLETIAYLLGAYALNMSPETLAQKQRDSRAPSGDIARLAGCRFLHASEPSKRMIFDVALLKTLLGRDKITARHLHEREFEFVPIFVLFINTNYLPLVNDDTLFSSGRIKVITFNRHFSEEEQDKGLKRRLQSPENLSGVLNWCLEGLRLYREEGLTPPASVVAATEDYRKQSDKVGLFIAEDLKPDPEKTLEGSFVYKRYVDWCRNCGYGIENKKNFFEELRAKGLLSRTGTIGGKTVRNVVRGYTTINESS